eukprot:gnl/Chilomastix_caulleri/5821.p2 GENE.gnl/Chilomastix_caulleri/5821~~gnl/Chilomastix_caulleri/5821.p2  ORF type:complete len:62 (-),score=14.13 gnl/Chilomastix_caulleri/5821:82-267(-)
MKGTNSNVNENKKSLAPIIVPPNQIGGPSAINPTNNTSIVDGMNTHQSSQKGTESSIGVAP